MPRRVSCIPSSDAGFRQAATAALASIDNDVGPDRIALILCDLLIDRFPDVDVHRQHELGRAFDDQVWYVYRDGRPRHGTEVDPN